MLLSIVHSSPPCPTIDQLREIKAALQDFQFSVKYIQMNESQNLK